MISKWRLTASADEVISHRDLGIIRRDALSLQSVSDAFVPLRGRKEKCDLFLFGSTMQLNLHWNSKLTLVPSLAWTSFSFTTLFFLVRKKSFSRWVLSSFSSVHKTKEESAEVRQAVPSVAAEKDRIRGGTDTYITHVWCMSHITQSKNRDDQFDINNKQQRVELFALQGV